MTKENKRMIDKNEKILPNGLKLAGSWYLFLGILSFVSIILGLFFRINSDLLELLSRLCFILTAPVFSIFYFGSGTLIHIFLPLLLPIIIFIILGTFLIRKSVIARWILIILPLINLVYFLANEMIAYAFMGGFFSVFLIFTPALINIIISLYLLFNKEIKEFFKIDSEEQIKLPALLKTIGILGIILGLCMIALPTKFFLFNWCDSHLCTFYEYVIINLIGLIFIVFSIGLMNGKNWARKSMAILSIFSGVLYLIRAFNQLIPSQDIMGFVCSIIIFIIFFSIAYYLLLSNKVKEVLQR